MIGSVIAVVGYYVFLLTTIFSATKAALNLVVPLSYVALVFWLLGNGIVKPTTVALTGDQFNEDQDAQRSQYFSWFYLSIQLGSIVPSIGVPILLQQQPAWISFATMAGIVSLGFPIFLAPSGNYNKKIPAGSVLSMFFSIIRDALCPGGKQRIRDVDYETIDPKERHWLDRAKAYHLDKDVEDVKKAVGVLSVFLPLPFFFGIFFQIYSLWVAQAGRMDTQVGSFSVPPGSTTAINPLFDLMIIPLTAKLIYPALKDTRFELTDLRKMALGFALFFYLQSTRIFLKIYPQKGTCLLLLLALSLDSLTCG